MPTDDAAILLESVAFEYLHGSAPRISIRATVTKDAGIAGAALTKRKAAHQGLLPDMLLAPVQLLSLIPQSAPRTWLCLLAAVRC